MTKDFLRSVYDLENQAATDAYYTAWAATYDEELTRTGKVRRHFVFEQYKPLIDAMYSEQTELAVTA